MATLVSDIRIRTDGVYIGRPRAGQPWNFGNPFRIGRDGSTAGSCSEKFNQWLLDGSTFGCPDATEARRSWILDNLHTLHNKTLLCWCKGAPHCHGHVLARFALTHAKLTGDGPHAI